MKSNFLRSYFTCTRQQRLGIVILLALIFGLQLLICFADFTNEEKPGPEAEKWLSQKPLPDPVSQGYTLKTHPFNPNFITDFKGYKLGMSPIQIDCLHAYRKRGRYVNSPQEFQRVTGVSDSLLNAIAPYFKFPDWLNKSKPYRKTAWVDYTGKPAKTKKPKIDINRATKEELMEIYGIGEAISERIIKLRDRLGAFVSMEQMEDVWGLSPEVVEKLNESFAVLENPNPKKIAINDATIKALGQFPYFRYPISRNIVTYRSMHGDLRLEDLANIKDFPLDKIKIIALYLDF